jgi:lysophospholipase L1-like esterase
MTIKTPVQKFLFFLRWLAIVLVLTLLLLEVVLQIAALFMQKHASQAHWLHPGSVRVLAMGDSNTYGLYLQADQAYPALLQKNWNQHHPERPIEVINLAYPGTNSSRVLKNFPDVIKTFSPDVITVMVGVNDFWMAPVDVDGVTSPVAPWQIWLREHSRVFKLVYLLQRQAYNAELLKVDDEYRHATFNASPQQAEKWRAAIHGEGAAPFPDKPSAIRYGEKTFDIGYVFHVDKNRNPVEDMRAHFEKMADIAWQSNIKLVFITYAYFEMPQKAANQQMKVVSKEKNIPLVIATKAFREQCEQGAARCQEMFFPDYHPSAAGHQLLASMVEDQLANLLQ